MRKLIYFLLIFFTITISAQKNEGVKEAQKFQEKLNKEFANKQKSPLTEEDFKTFEALDFFPIDTNYRVIATLKFYENSKTFKMKTTTDRLPEYKIYASATFKINGTEHVLHIYQNQKLLLNTDYEDYLFLPFTDNTNGVSSYGGGRYIDLNIPKGDTMIIDFNQAYNPYCAYNHKYSCPIPPSANDLNIEIPVGVKKYSK
jgi:hypothetical protein